MALDPHAYPSTLDRSAYQYVDDYLSIWEAMAQPLNRLTLLDMLPTGEELTDRTYYWTEDNASRRTVTLGEPVDSSETTISLDTGHAAYLQKGDFLHQYSEGKTEWMQVIDDPDTSNDTILVNRNYNSSGTDTFADRSELRIVRMRPEGSEADEPEFKGTNRVYNYTGIISHTVRLDGSAAAGQPRAPYGDELDRQEAEVLSNLRFELEDLMLYGPGGAPSSTAYGSLLGIRGNIVAGAGDNYISSGEYRGTYKQYNADLNWLARQGFIKPNSNVVIFGPPDMATEAANWKASQVTYEKSDRTYGLEVPVLISALGIRAPFLWNPDAKSDEYMILNLDRIKKHPLRGRALIRMRKAPYVDLQDWEGRRLLMEWGVSVQYRTKAHFLRTGVDFTS